jgi:hypothetical protein
MNTVTIQVPPQHTGELLAVLQRWHSTTPTTDELITPTSSEPAVTLEALRQALTKISQDGKAAQIKTLLAEFGARNVKELVPTDFAAVLEKAGAL